MGHPALPIIRNKSFDSYCQHICQEKIDPIGFYHTRGLNQCNQQAEWLLDEKKKLIPDFIGRFESLQKDFEKVCEIIEIPKRDLPKTNTSKHRHYSTYYNKETKKMVAEAYKQDIELFGYGFERTQKRL